MSRCWVVLYGGPGSGKSTQAALLARYLKVAYLNMGGALREFSYGSSSLAQKVARLISTGRLAPLTVTNRVTSDFAAAHRKQTCLIADGYPRNLSQARHFLRLAKQEKRKVVFFFLELSLKEALLRLRRRARLVRRQDDLTYQAIKTRLAIFKQSSRGLLNLFSNRGALVRVRGTGTPRVVQQRLVSYLKREC